MSTAISQYPFFDLSEIIHEPDFTFKPYQPLRPVKTGNYLPGFTLNKGYTHWQHFFNGTKTHGPLLLRQLLNKPLVISFYSPEWKAHGLEQLKQLNAIQREVKASGGNLLVITTANERELEKLVWENNLSLNFYFDPSFSIARGLRIYDETDPVWNRFSGVDTNVPLPATYVIDASRQVVFDHTNLNFIENFSSAKLISAVYEASLAVNLRKSA